MDSNLTEKLQSILSDKDAVDRLKQLAGSLNLQDGTGSGHEHTETNSTQEGTAVGASFDGSDNFNSKDRRGDTHGKRSSEDHIKLISAIRAYLSPERQEMADNIIRLLKLMKLADFNKLLRG